MAGYTKADFDAQYSIRAEREWGHPSDRVEVRLHYHHGVIYNDYISPRWDGVISLLGLTSADFVIVAGAGFGWGVEKLIIAVPGITVIGTDISDYVETESVKTEDVELDAAITRVGLDPITGRGAQIKAKYARLGNRTQSVVVNEDMLSRGSRGRILAALGSRTPTYVFTEDMVLDMTDRELTDWAAAADEFATATKIHLISSESERTVANVQAITSHRVLLFSTTGVQADTR